jgi:hypothetical protein
MSVSEEAKVNEEGVSSQFAESFQFVFRNQSETPPTGLAIVYPRGYFRKSAYNTTLLNKHIKLLNNLARVNLEY